MRVFLELSGAMGWREVKTSSGFTGVGSLYVGDGGREVVGDERESRGLANCALMVLHQASSAGKEKAGESLMALSYSDG